MRNLKRALSVALASAMLLGMMMVGTSAKGIDDFTDKDKIVNQDAVAVTAEIGVFDGYENGSFGPENVVTRAEMAVIICTMLYGAGVNVNQFAETSVFTDVPDWAEGYVNLCASLGIVAGVGDGKFDPSATVTTAQAVLMLCRTLGYFQSATDFGNDWMLAATAKGTELGMYGDLKLTANAGLTRDNVAELVFNALTKAVTVEYNDTFNIYFNTGSTWANGVKFDYKQTLGYKNFDLVYMNDEDDFGRPSTVWGTGSLANVSLDDEGNIPDSYKGIADDDIIISMADTATHTYTAKVSSKTLYNDVGRTAAQDYDWTVYTNGEANEYSFDGNDLYDNRTSTDCFLKEAAGENVTGNGVLTQVYVDSKEKEVTVSVIDSYVAEVYKVDEKDGTITLSDLVDGPADASDDEFATTAFAEDDVVVYTYANDEIQSVVKAESVEGTVTKVKDKDNFSLDGTSYSYSKNMDASDKLDTDDVDAETVAYLDAYGYVIHLDADAVAQDYAYVVGVGSANDKYGDDADFGATLLLTDATKLKVDLDSDSTDKYDSTQEAREALEGYIVSYSKDSDGLYTLTKRSDNRIDLNENTFNATGLEIKSGTSAMKIFATDDYYANSSTIFLLYDGDDYTVYTGIKNVPDVKGDADTNAVVFDKGGVAKVVYIENANVDGDDEVIFVVGDTGAKAQKDNETNTKYYEYQAMVGGEIVKLKVRDGDAYDFFKTIKTDEIQVLSGLTYNKDGFVTDYDKNFTDWTVKTGIGTEGEDDEVIGIGDAAGKNYATYAYDEDVVVARFDGDDLTKSTIGRIKDDGNDKVTYVLDGKVLMGVCINEVKGTEMPKSYTLTLTEGTGTDLSATVNGQNTTAFQEGDKIVITAKAETGYKDLTVTVDGKAVTLDGNGQYSFTAKAGDVKIVSSATSTNMIDSKLNVTVTDSTGVTGFAVTDAHIVTASDDKTTPSGKYNGMSDGDLYLAFTAPDGVTIGSVSAVNFEIGNQKFSNVTATGTGTSGDITVKVAKANVPSAVASASSVKIDIPVTVSGQTYPVSVNTPRDIYVEGGSDTTSTLSKTSGAAIKVKLSGIANGVKTVDVAYEVTGLTGGTKTGTANGQTVTAGAVAITNLTGASETAADNVTVTIKSVTPATVEYTVDSEVDTHEVDTISDTPNAGSEAALAGFDVQAASGSIMGRSKAKITFTVSGIEGGPKQFTTKELTAATNKYTVNASAFDGGMPQITPDGKGAVTITLNKVEITSVRAQYTEAITNAVSGDVVKSFNDQSTTATDGDVAVVDGKFTATLTLSNSGKNGDATAGDYIAKSGGDEKSEVTAISSGHQTIVFEVTADDTADYNFVVSKI